MCQVQVKRGNSTDLASQNFKLKMTRIIKRPGPEGPEPALGPGAGRFFFVGDMRELAAPPPVVALCPASESSGRLIRRLSRA